MSGPVIFLQPKIYITKSSLNAGETQTITGTQYISNGTVRLNITGPDGYSQITTLIVTSNGSITYSLNTNNSMPAGIYNIWATDNNSGHSSSLKSFQFINNTIPANYLKITSPVIATSSEVNNPFSISWSDRPSHISTLIQNTSLVNASYKIEFNKDNSGWQLNYNKIF